MCGSLHHNSLECRWCIAEAIKGIRLLGKGSSWASECLSFPDHLGRWVFGKYRGTIEENNSHCIRKPLKHLVHEWHEMVNQFGLSEVGRPWYFVRKAPCPLLPQKRTALKLEELVGIHDLGIASRLCWSFGFAYFALTATLALNSFSKSVFEHRMLMSGELAWLVVLHGRKTGLSDLVCLPSVADVGQLRYEWAPPQVTQLCSTAFTGAGAGIGDICLSRSRALTMSFNSANIGRYYRGGSARTHFSNESAFTSGVDEFDCSL
ncbi:hypothetical protein Tco_1253407 [Tanacetum coccineum]